MPVSSHGAEINRPQRIVVFADFVELGALEQVSGRPWRASCSLCWQERDALTESATLGQMLDALILHTNTCGGS